MIPLKSFWLSRLIERYDHSMLLSPVSSGPPEKVGRRVLTSELQFSSVGRCPRSVAFTLIVRS